MAVVTIVGAGMMGSALAFPAAENKHEVRLVGTHLDREIIGTCKQENRHPKFTKTFPKGVKFYETEELETALAENARLQEEAANDFARVGELFAEAHKMEEELEKLYGVLDELG